MGKPKVIVQLYPVFPAKDEHDRRAKRPIGRDSDLYYKIVHEWSEIIQAADQMGVWACRPSSITCIPKVTRWDRIPES